MSREIERIDTLLDKHRVWRRQATDAGHEPEMLYEEWVIDGLLEQRFRLQGEEDTCSGPC